ncbi:hypothetical protein DFJ77DRAFT_214736 [Powellomyces hirtus]|nr:hypothetical protein DFJ77DRAFT_214736 [Powellomyces hirtus]
MDAQNALTRHSPLDALQSQLRALEHRTRSTTALVASTALDVETRKAACAETNSEIYRLRNFIELNAPGRSREETASAIVTPQLLDVEEETVIREHVFECTYLHDRILQLAALHTVLSARAPPPSPLSPACDPIPLAPLLTAPPTLKSATATPAGAAGFNPNTNSATSTYRGSISSQRYANLSHTLRQWEDRERGLVREIARVNAYIEELELLGMTAALSRAAPASQR